MLRRYRGFMADSARWERFEFRPDDVIISSPSKCGTTWTQQIVGSLLLDQPVLDRPISELSPWLDMETRPMAEVRRMLGDQRHRRVIKTHIPLDGVPIVDGVTYLGVGRHPLDLALSALDHAGNLDAERVQGVDGGFRGRADGVGHGDPGHHDQGDVGDGRDLRRGHDGHCRDRCRQFQEQCQPVPADGATFTSQ